MNRRTIASRELLVSALALMAMGGCGQLFLNQTKERQGDVNIQFVNTTPFRAIFSYGTYDALDRNPPGAVTLEQLRLSGNGTSEVTAVSCRRTVAVGTQAFIDRAVETSADETPEFDPEAFNATVSFSSAPEGTTTEGLPTEGTADGLDKLLGVDYSCGDLLIFKFVQDPDAPGGFRIDFEVVRDVEPGE